MIHARNGTLRYSPRDLVSYLEGDFAAWCDRMLAERGRAGGAGPAELEWATPDEDEELALAARMGQDHEQRWLAGLREREPGLVETAFGDANGPDLSPGGDCACAGYHYTPWDTKLARSAKPYFLIQRAVVSAAGGACVPSRLYKVGDHDDDPLVTGRTVAQLESDEVAGVLGAGAVLVGGTAWVFSRQELAGGFDYLFVDEAGQVSLANAVAVGLSTRNLVLVGDQMQLAQPSQGSHPGDTGLSCLEYFLHGHATVPPDMGIFLGTSYRMHERLCRFISESVYDGWLGSAADTSRHRVIRNAVAVRVPDESGIVWVPVSHDGCTQSSDEECDAIVAIVEELLARDVVGKDGTQRRMTLADILIVAPFNQQVRCLRQRLGAAARIGSVDKFQGQEAPVVIVSLCASTLDEAPRGAAFLLSPNRLNVAVSRAQALAIVVGCPDLLETRCRSVEEMRLVNLLCHLVQYAEGLL